MKAYIDGLKKAIEQIKTEYELCQMEIGDNHNAKEKLAYTKMAFTRAVGLIEDEMIQCGEVFPRNFYCDKIANL